MSCMWTQCNGSLSLEIHCKTTAIQKYIKSMITSSSLYAMFSLSFIISRRLLQQEFWSSSDQLHELHSEAPPIWLYRPSFAYSRLIVPRRLSIQHQCCKTKPQIRAINQAIKSSMPNTTINVKHGTVPQDIYLYQWGYQMR